MINEAQFYDLLFFFLFDILRQKIISLENMHVGLEDRWGGVNKGFSNQKGAKSGKG